MKKSTRLLLLIFAILLIVFTILSVVFRDFMFAKNEIFNKTGTSIHLVYAPPFEIKNTKNQFYIRKVQNLIEKADKEIVEKEFGKGWKMRGSITVDNKHYALYMVGDYLQIGDTVYHIKDDSFKDDFKKLFDKIKNPK